MLKKYRSKIGLVYATAMEVTSEFIKSPPKEFMDDTKNVFLQRAGNKLYMYYKLEGDSYPVEEGDMVGFSDLDELSVWGGVLFKKGFKELK